MKAKILGAALGAVMMAPFGAHAITGFTDSSTSLRAGPNRDFPRLERIPRNVRVEVYGCLARYDWCDVSYRGYRGWIDSDDLEIPYRDRRAFVREYGASVGVPVISFRFDSYWDDNYRRTRFYRDRDSWRERSRVWYPNDQDRDGIPNRYDRDRDGDGRPNRYDRDRDGDGVPNRRDDAPNNPRRD